MSFKVAFIGAGSLVFARTLFTDIMSVPEFRDIEVAFTDINATNLERTRALCQRDLDANGIPVTIEATTDRRKAFENARYIALAIRFARAVSCTDSASSRRCLISARISARWQSRVRSC